MASIRDPERAVKDALIRAEGYRLLALAVRHPEVEELRAELAAAPHELGGVGSLLPLVDDDMPSEHTRLFAQSTPVSPYEGSYVPGDKGVLLGQLAALYELFGVKVGGEHEPVDHLGCQLEFAALLSLKQALCLRDGSEEHLEVTRGARRVFMQEHLGRWVGPFARRLRERSQHAYFHALAELLPDWVARDLESEGWEAERLTDERSLPVVESDAVSCPMEPREPG